MSHSYVIECPNYKTGCDIENCPRLLDNVDVKLGKNGELVGSGFCTVRGGRYFDGISYEKIRVLAGKWQGAETVSKTCSRAPLFTPEYELEIMQTLKLDSIDDLAKFDREKISQLPLPDDKRTTALMAATKYRLRNAPEAEWSAAFTDYETAENAIFLYGIRREVDEGGTKFDRLHCILDCRKDYDGLRFRKLVLDLIDTFFDVFDAADFYSGLRQIDIYETPSRRMASEHGLIGWLDTARRDIDNFVRWFKCSKLDPRLLTLSLHALFAFLDKVCGTQFYPPSFEQQSLVQSLTWFAEGEGDEIETDYLKTTLQRISTALKDLQTALSICEHKVYDRHPEWEVIYHAGGEFDDLKAGNYRRNYSEAFRAYYDKYGNPLEQFETVAAYLRGAFHPGNPLPIGSAPLAFLTPTRFSSSYDYSEDLAKLLSTPVSFSYLSLDSSGEETTAADSPNTWIANAKAEMCEALYDYCHRRVKPLPPDSAAKKLWLRAVAILMQSRRNDNILVKLTEEKAKAFIEAANDAANEEWIERQTGGGKSMDTPAIQKVTDETILRKLDDIAQKQKRGQEEIRGALEANTKATTNLGRKVDAAKSGVKTVTTGLATIFPKLGACTEEEAGKAFGLIPQYVGLDKITNIAHRSQIKAAIDYSYKNGLAVHKPKPDGTTEHPNITDLAETVWGIYEDKWQLIPDSYKTLTDYRSALLHHFGEYPDSLLHCTD